MKKLNLFTKLSALACCLALVVTMLIPSLTGVFALTEPHIATTPITSTFSLTNVASEYVIGESTGNVTIAKQAGYTIKIYSPNNTLLSRIESDATDGYSFIPTVVGTYTVKYFSGETCVLTREIDVSKKSVELVFPTNTDRIIPAYMNLSYEGDVKCPVAKVDGELTGVTVELAVPAGSSATLVDDATVVGSKKFNPDKVGEYRVTYKYTKDSIVLAEKTFTMQVNTTYNNDYVLEYTLNSSKPTVGNIGVNITLPTVTGKNKETGDKVDVNYDIQVKVNGTVVTESSTDLAVLNGNILTPVAKGDYTIKYVITNFFGTEAESFSFTIEDIDDDVKPEVFFGANQKDEAYTLPSKSTSENVILPAISAKDNSNGELTYRRRIENSSSDIETLDETYPSYPIIINANSDKIDEIGTAGFTKTESKCVVGKYDVYENSDGAGILVVNFDENSDEFAFAEGEYTVLYSAKDADANETVIQKSITIDNDFVSANTDTTIKFDTVLPASVKVGEEVSFVVPTATDINDGRLLVETYYSIDYSTETADVKSSSLTEAVDGKYTITPVDTGVITIETRVYKNSKDEDLNPYTQLIKTITVNAINDNVAPVVSATTTETADAYNQGDTYDLATLSITDNYLDYVLVRYVVTDKDGANVNVFGKTSNIESGELKVQGAKFVGYKSGIYSVSIIATDIAGNTTVVSYKTSSFAGVVDQTNIAPIFNSSLTEVELGESLNLPIPTVKDADGNEIVNPSYVIEVTESTGEYAIENKSKFIAYSQGTFKIKYVVTIGATTVDSAEYVISVKDTKAPVITNVYEDSELVLAKDTSLVIEKLAANDASGIDWTKSTVKIVPPSGTVKTFKSDDTNYNYTFSKNGKYTLTYTAKDVLDNTSTKSFTFRVGDTESPVLVFDEGFELTDKKPGEKLIIYKADLTATDVSDTSISLDDLKITVKKPDGTKVELVGADYETEDYYCMNLDATGEYSVEFVLTDNAGLQHSVVKSVVVAAETKDALYPAQVIGIVLICVAVVVLVGVVAYFIIIKNKKSKIKIDRKK